MKNALLFLLSVALAASWLIPRPPVVQIVQAEPEPAPAAPLPPPAPAPAPEAPSRYAVLESALLAAREEPGLQGAALGFCLIDSTGAVVVNDHAETACIPASTLKTVTTSTALERLGPDFRFTTTLRTTAPVQEGILTGDLVITGGADPLLSLTDLADWAEKLKAGGLREIRGRIIGDGRFLTGSLYADFWNWGDIGNGYGSAVSGLNLEHNRFRATFTGGATPGDPVAMPALSVDIPGITLANEVLTGPPDSGDNVVIYGGERTGLITFRGTVPAGAETTVTGAIPDPETFTAVSLAAALRAAGITVSGPALAIRNAEATPTGPPLLEHASPPLLELITSIHATSDNHETECLYRRLGIAGGKPPLTVIREHWQARGLTFTGLRMEDGCGLARADFIRPLDLARLQFLAGQGPQGPAYKGSLLSDGPVRWKGGAMSGVRSYTGYITTPGGEEFCFALMVNHYSDSQPVSALRRTVIELVSKL